MPTLNDLLTDPGATIELVIKGQYLDENDALNTEWVSQHGWDDQVTGPSGTYCPPLAEISLSIDQSVEPLDLSSSFGSFSSLTLINDDLNFRGRYDSWWQYTVDGLEWTVYAVGMLSTGERVELSDVENTPLYVLYGVDGPEGGSSYVRIKLRDGSTTLSSALQPDTYSPPCLVFPGLLTTPGAVNFGDILDITGSAARSFWVWIDNPGLTSIQYLLHKDSGTTGHYLAVGLVSGGTIAGGVELGVRGQSPVVTVTAANVLRARQWHRIDISIDIAAGTRRIDVDGTTLVTTAGVTGTPTGNSQDLLMGYGLFGRLSRFLAWNIARSNATMSAEGRTPIVGNETNLDEYFPLDDGFGPKVSTSKIGALTSGTLGASVTWNGNADWHYSSIAGENRPLILGTVLRAPLTWIDPVKQIAEASYGGLALISELQSNHAVVATSSYTVNRQAGTLQITTGSLFGTYSVTATANNFWNSALYFGTGAGAVPASAITSPTGSRSLKIQYRVDSTENALRYAIGWQSGAAAGAFFIRYTTGAVNRIEARAINDAGTQFFVQVDGMKEARTYDYAACLNTSASTVNGQPGNTLYFYIDGSLAGSTAVSGAWTAALTTFAVGRRPDVNSNPAMGRLDDPLVFSRVLSQAEIRALMMLPATGAESGLLYAWHLDDATGSSAASLMGSSALTLTSTTWVAGRSAATDLARWVLYEMADIVEGEPDVDIDFDSWFAALVLNPADQGWAVLKGQAAEDVLDLILGGVGMIHYPGTGGTIKLRRFEGLTGIAENTFAPELYLENVPIEPEACDPAVYEWTLTYATNNAKMDKANIAGSLATSDPDRYEYGAQAHKTAVRNDLSVLNRDQNAAPKTRNTALIYQRDAQDEADRLLAIHKYGSDTKKVAAFLLPGSVDILSEQQIDQSLTELDASTVIFIGISIEDDRAMIRVWRPRITS